MRLSSISTRNGGFCLVDYSHPETLAELVGVDLSVPLNKPAFTKIHQAILATLSAHSSGVILEPDWSLPIWADIHSETAEPINAGMLLSLTKPLPESGELPKLDPNWGIDAIKNNYAVPILTLPYHPSEKNAVAKKQFVAELADYCAYQQLDFVLRLQLTAEEGQQISADDMITTIQEMQKYVALLVLPAPGDALTAATITAELDKPWVVELGVESYDGQKEALRMALEAGAKGFLAASLWQDVTQFRQPQTGVQLAQIESFATTTLRDRLLELNRITTETVTQ